MKWIKLLFKPFIWLYDNFEPIDDDPYFSNPSRETDMDISSVNPETSLPMIGDVDSSGNTFGTSSSNWYHDYS